ncbi:MAG TPA: bifunctional UDP-3-O-[3-hydroxymyristoyl] N-acetylglucosamine deacetylase/3-hydroxyacyl-ACP dehydratase [bacterium]|nr:bifunctional UDP-3-O-[3-hydroxymyristoyl] N-acetylglucosamine deacetylase/3-hydroxyacyl-ACP dehydratase [bacterium]
MIANQRTIQNEASLAGTGLHTGNKTRVTFKPAEPNTGIRFRRTDIENCPEIPADIEHVIDNFRDTTLGIGNIHIRQVEHVLAAVYGLEIDNILVEIDSNEPPVGDGSAMPFVEVLQQAGIQEQDAPRDYIEIQETIAYSDPEKGIDMVVFPSDEFRITFMVDYRNPALGTQYTSMYSLTDEFVTEFASARTFCFLDEVEALYDKGLIQGGNLENAVVIVDRQLSQDELQKLADKFGIKQEVALGSNGILGGKQLRYTNEPVRHKTLDLIGDLALLGAPIKAHVMAARSGHATHVELVKKIRQIYKAKKLTRKYQTIPAKKGVLLDCNAINRILPHRYPFLLVDKIIDVVPTERVVGVKNVTQNEPFFPGHFPGHPIMPGVLIVEAMAQTGAVLMLETVQNPETKVAYFMAIDNVKFRKPVVPGDQLIMEVEMIRFRPTSCKMMGHAYVDGDLVCQAELMAVIMDK